MNSKVIKCVAGAGKTTSSCEYMQTHKNGLYLAFNNDNDQFMAYLLKNKYYSEANYKYITALRIILIYILIRI